ncbi:daunorubicin C-13 ketoreductase [Sporothrix schenckii 1099-18]|uniref:Daunorubicin C-13 ketoreductase n=1 Tax=Sporothrix schenckii 1099-18 TaxID=1397361 RepID=A0A0F2MAZ7_SPOSC|nr:daunorubicin C-13 ketoreductase [Sporothrix schenckii 1099-18]KJR86817.1 daunorubicin C-13 ketoreductase [Sporothrix schenckii 1099-18]
MARIFITGSSDGIGLLTAKRLVADGHRVVLHARNAKRARETEAACPGAEAVLTGDLCSIAETKALAAQAQALLETEPGARYDAVIHNAGVYRGQDNAVSRDTGFPRLFVVNTLAPYILAVSMAAPLPRRLIFISSSMHYGGRPKLETLPRGVTYSDSKVHMVMLAKAFARRWANGLDVSVSADPGWVPTKLGGWSAPDSIDGSVATYTALALGQGEAKGSGGTNGRGVSGKYFVNSRAEKPQPVTNDEALQDELIAKLASLSSVPMVDI